MDTDFTETALVKPINRRLTLVRHGRSSYEYAGRFWMSRRDMQTWRDGYDAAGIVGDENPPPGLADLVATADLVIASDMSRAMQTAQRLTSRELLVSPLVRETPPPIPNWMHLRMPRQVWEWIALVRWGYWIARGIQGPPDAMERAAEASKWLDGLSAEYEHIVVVTHGTFRRLLTYKLVQIGWRQAAGTSRSYKHWSTWSLIK